MRIKFLRDWSGRMAGEVHDLENSLARQLIKRGYAVLHKAETAVVEAAQTVTQHIDFPGLTTDVPAHPTDSPDTGATEKEES